MVPNASKKWSRMRSVRISSVKANCFVVTCIYVIEEELN